jgi:hypothetical protein
MTLQWLKVVTLDFELLGNAKVHEFGEKKIGDLYRKGIISDRFSLVLLHEKRQLVAWS